MEHVEQEDVPTVADKEDISSETVLADLQARIKQLEDSNNIKDNTIAEQNDLLEDKSKKLEAELLANTKLKSENNKWTKTIEEMRERVECQVCLLLPKDGPVPMCPNDHFICSICKGKRRQEEKFDCPTCKEPLGAIKSLLAKTVIENVKHECDLEGCKKMIDYSEFKTHQEECDFRLVRCPGYACEEMVAFNLIIDHARGCNDNYLVLAEDSVDRKCLLDWNISEKGFLSKDITTWQTSIIETVKSETIFFRMRKSQNIFEMEVVMKGSKDDCLKYDAEIPIHDIKTGDVVLQMCHSPRPISTLDWGPVRLLVSQETLASWWKLDPDTKKHKFLVGVEMSEKKQ